ncbi:hypothetical protein EZJ19_12915 [Parasulfuritortus cantonensis]|uniref:Uncharacterized protein n=1 Tax=Parasulfuritortus cantonensis TaxID=2528202 RepID=A0A4R1B734_9PROT|nr:hypothetical protein [Parasulfuritortus cantonensis]TCJ12238.1 hypothetical protein EZJ19_12915 [Parasulfuritortus cantonensis]
MSKLDEKLAASVTPATEKASPNTPAGKGGATAKRAAARPPARKPARPAKPASSADLNAPEPPLFPARIWPD